MIAYAIYHAINEDYTTAVYDLGSSLIWTALALLGTSSWVKIRTKWRWQELPTIGCEIRIIDEDADHQHAKYGITCERWKELMDELQDILAKETVGTDAALRIGKMCKHPNELHLVSTVYGYGVAKKFNSLVQLFSQ